MTDKKLATAQGWTLYASHDGERWSLHVENDWQERASLACAVNEGEVTGAQGRPVHLKAPTMALFDRWMDQADAFLAMAEEDDATPDHIVDAMNAGLLATYRKEAGQ